MQQSDYKSKRSPEQTLPRGEVRSPEERVFEDTLDTSQRLNHVCAVVVEVPELAVVALVSPPEGVLLEHLELFEVCTYAPALVIGQCVPVFLEQCVDARDTTIPTVLQVLQCQSPINSTPTLNSIVHIHITSKFSYIFYRK